MIKPHRTPSRHTAFLIGIGTTLVGIIAVFAIFAAGNPIGFEPESGSLASGATVTTVSGQSGTGAVKFASGTSVPPVPSLGWQINATNTGLARFGLTCASLPAYTGGYYIPAGSNISGVRFTGHVNLNKGNITIDKSCFRPLDVGSGVPIAMTTDTNICEPNGGGCLEAQGPVTISNSEFDGSLIPDARRQAFTVGFHGIANLYSNYIHDVGGGLAIFGAGDKFSSVVQGNYAHRMKNWGDAGTTGNHIDVFTVRDFELSAANPTRTLLVKGNRFDCDAPSNCTGAFFIQAWSGKINNMTAQDNLIEGDGYGLVLEGNANGYTNMRAINNRFAPTGYGAGYVDYTKGTGWTEQRDNHINDPTKPDNKGTPVSF